jgi:serine/threonine-protein kinase HipA
MWGHTVGAVSADPELGCYAFEYDPAWVRSGVEAAPIQMPLAEASRVFAFPALPESFRKLPGLLADALPDDFGNALIDAWMARHGIQKAAISALDRLAYMGKRSMGALEFRPALAGSLSSQRPLEMKSLVEAARIALKGDFNHDSHAQAALANIIQVGTSAGGARAKAVVAWNASTGEIRSGQFDVLPGFEHWLIKFDGVGKDLELGSSADYGRIEYAYHLMAAKGAGICMEPCRLLKENGRAHFMTRRFDRANNTKHHVQSLCALDHLDYKQRATHSYEQLFLVIEKLQLGDVAKVEAFKRMVFNVVARNMDDHTKNFAFLLKKGGGWELAPAYDVTYAHNAKGEWTYQHLLSVNGKFDQITRQDMIEVAEQFSIPRASTTIETVCEAVSKWSDYASEADLPPDRAAEIAADFSFV